MLIRFDELARTVVPHMKGGEGEAQLQSVTDADNKIMRSVLTPGLPSACTPMRPAARSCISSPARARCSVTECGSG